MTTNYTPVDKTLIKKGGWIDGFFRTASPQRQFKREQRRKHLKLKQLGEKTSPKPEGFG